MRQDGTSILKEPPRYPGGDADQPCGARCRECQRREHDKSGTRSRLIWRRLSAGAGLHQKRQQGASLNRRPATGALVLPYGTGRTSIEILIGRSAAQGPEPGGSGMLENKRLMLGMGMTVVGVLLI